MREAFRQMKKNYKKLKSMKQMLQDEKEKNKIILKLKRFFNSHSMPS